MSLEIGGQPHMVKQTIDFSDGTKTEINYNKNIEAEEIEKESAEMVEEHKDPEEIESLPEEVTEESIEEQAEHDIKSVGEDEESL